MHIWKPDWIAAIGTILLAILAVFQDKIRAWLARPKLELQAGIGPPYSYKTSWVYPYWPIPHGAEAETEYFPCYYFRLAIRNNGNVAAHQVELFAASLSSCGTNGQLVTVKRFTPMNLMWAHEHKVYLPVLSPKMTKFCDLAHLVDPRFRSKLDYDLPGVPANDCVLAFDLQVEPKMKGHLLEPGEYQLTLIVAAENARPREYVVKFTFSGEWYDAEETMFDAGFRLRVI
ncbi:MAG: hypothetical protein WAN69_14025 [Candidatus Korobacteraceae bacterium]